MTAPDLGLRAFSVTRGEGAFWVGLAIRAMETSVQRMEQLLQDVAGCG